MLWFLILAESQATGPPLRFTGLVRPLWMFNPGLDHPPPGTGEGLRERDIPGAGVPKWWTVSTNAGSRQTEGPARDTRAQIWCAYNHTRPKIEGFGRQQRVAIAREENRPDCNLWRPVAWWGEAKRDAVFIYLEWERGSRGARRLGTLTFRGRGTSSCRSVAR